MAYLLVRASAAPRIVAESISERALLAHARRRGGELLLEDAGYPIDGEMLVLPESITRGAAQRLCDALTHCAERHRQATLRRRRFRAV